MHGEPADEGDGLWMVMATIQRHRLDSVTLALEGLTGFGGMTVSDCRGFGRGKVARVDDASGPGGQAFDDVPPAPRQDADLVDFTAKVRLDIAVAGRDHADAVVGAIVRAAHTGRKGDGKVFMWPLVRAVRVRTGEQDAAAI